MVSAAQIRLRERLERALSETMGPSSDYDLLQDASAVAPTPAVLRPAGVLAAFDDNARLVMTMRSSSLRHHPGQISLPGGKVEPSDPDAVAAALREADEEIGLPPARVLVLGTLPPHRTVTNFDMTPVIGLIDGPFTPIPEAGEVGEAFTVPFAHIADLSNYRVERRMWRGAERAYYIVPYGPYYIWGATARVLHALALQLNT